MWHWGKVIVKHGIVGCAWKMAQLMHVSPTQINFYWAATPTADQVQLTWAESGAVAIKSP